MTDRRQPRGQSSPTKTRERGDERLADHGVTVLLLKRALLTVGIIASIVVDPGAAGERQRRSAVPRRAGEGRVDVDAPAAHHDRQVSVDIDEPVVRNDRRDLGAEQLSRTSLIQRVDAVNDPRRRVGKPLRENAGKEQVLGGARTALLTQHPLYGAITRTAIGQGPQGFNELNQRRVE